MDEEQSSWRDVLNDGVFARRELQEIGEICPICHVHLGFHGCRGARRVDVFMDACLSQDIVIKLSTNCFDGRLGTLSNIADI